MQKDWDNGIHLAKEISPTFKFFKSYNQMGKTHQEIKTIKVNKSQNIISIQQSIKTQK